MKIKDWACKECLKRHEALKKKNYRDSQREYYKNTLGEKRKKIRKLKKLHEYRIKKYKHNGVL